MEQPLYSPSIAHYPSMLGNPYMNPYGQPYVYAHQMPHANTQQMPPPQSQPMPSPQSQSQQGFSFDLESDFDAFEMVQETQPPLNVSQARRLVDSESSDSSDSAPAESEPSEPSNQTKKNKKGKAPRAPSIKWNEHEVTTLAEAWLSISEDAAKGTDQKGEKFEDLVWESWCRRMNKTYRTPSQLYSKWRKVNKLVTLFNGFWIQVNRAPQSGSSEMDVFEKADRLFARKEGAKFLHSGFWKAVKDHPKWLNLDSFDDFTGRASRARRSQPSVGTMSSSRSNSSVGTMGIDLNLNDDYQPPQKKLGRDAAKRKLKGVASGSADVAVDEAKKEAQDINLNIAKMMEIEATKNETRALKYFFKDTSKLSEEDRDVVSKAKANLKKRFNW